MGNNSSSNDEYANDPYIRQSQNANYNIRNLYSNSSLTPINQQNLGNIDPKSLANQQKKIGVQAFKNPLQLDRNSIKLEKDAYNINIYYIVFKYTAPKEIYVNFYFNCAFNPNAPNNNFYAPSPAFQNDIVRLTLEPGNNKECKDKILLINMDYFFRNKIYDNNLTDVIIELYSLDPNGNVECIVNTFCKVLNKPNLNTFELKSLYQKCKVFGSEWYSLQDIYGLNSDDNLCEICCENKKNTFFEPCKHSFACKDCAIMLRIKGNGCPICRQPISESVVLETGNINK